MIPDPEVMAFCNRAFSHSSAKSLWPSRGSEEGFRLLDLKPVLTDTVRTNFITQGALGKAFENIFNSHRISGAINEFGKNLDVNAWIFSEYHSRHGLHLHVCDNAKKKRNLSFHPFTS